MTLLAENLKQPKKNANVNLSRNRKRKSKLLWEIIRRKVWQLPKKTTVSEWADNNRVLDPKTSADPGHWHTDRTPYTRGIMDAFADHYVEEITIKASTQIGKTESMLNMAAYAIDQDPGPMLFVMPRKDDAKMISTDRIQPMIELSPALLKHLTGYDDDVTQFTINLNRMILYLAWSQSPAALSSKPVKYLFLDETNKYPLFSGKEADPIKLATERTRTYWNRKIVKVSTPTVENGYISREYERSDKQRYYVPCPHCGKYQVLVWKQIKFPKEERNPEVIKAQRLAWYECENCREAITDNMKQKMMLRGKWVPQSCHIDKNGDIKGKRTITLHKGFWINALYSPWLTFSDIAAEWLRCQGRIELLMNFVNSWLAEEWKEKIEERKPDKLRKHACEYPSGTVPERAIVLTAGVDVQLDHFYYVIRAWGVAYESWLIEAGRVESWEEIVAKIFERRFASEIKNIPSYEVVLTCIDSGYRTTEVYEFCREWFGLARPTKGQQSLRGHLYYASNIDKFPNGKIIPGGLRLYHIDTNLMKDKLARLIGTEPSSSKWHLHSNPAQAYLDQMCAEGKVLEKGKKRGQRREIWRLLSSHAKNHLWDAEVSSLSAAEMLRVYALREDNLPKPVKEPLPEKHERPDRWVSRRKGWLKNG